MSFALCNLLSENISYMNTLMRKYTFSKHNKQLNKSQCYFISTDYASDIFNNSECTNQSYCNNFTDYCDNSIQNVDNENDVVIEF